MPDDRHRNDNLDGEMERDTEIRRETAISDALGPVEGTDAERHAAQSALSPEERSDTSSTPGNQGDTDERGGSTQPQRGASEHVPAAHVERGVHSDEILNVTDRHEVRNAEERE